MESNDRILIQEKVQQAVDILKELDADVWLTFIRETNAAGDPVLPLIYGSGLTWQSALIICKNGERIAILGSLEAETAKRIGAYSTIIPYNKSIRQPLVETLNRINPNRLAINYSKSDCLADGLGYGLYQVLDNYLADTPFSERLVSAERIIQALRGRKTSSEVQRIQTAIRTTLEIFDKTFNYAKLSMTENQISEFMHQQLTEYKVSPAWGIDHCPTVNSGPDSPVGHVGPGEIKIQAGHILHIDFGVKQDLYCSDIQRVAYFCKPGEIAAPQAVQHGFETVVRSIQAAVELMKPGISGREVDAAARSVLTEAGYPEYKYATGHHLGQLAHDGAGVLGPMWEKYGDTPNYKLEASHVYTVEPGLSLPGYGYIGLEEDVLVTVDGAIFLGQPQTEMILVNP